MRYFVGRLLFRNYGPVPNFLHDEPVSMPWLLKDNDNNSV